MGNKRPVTVLGAGYTGLTTAAELTLRGFKVNVVAADLGYRPPLTIVGTQVSNFFNLTKFFVKLISRKNSFLFQSRRWPGSAISNKTFDNDDLLDRELPTISRFIALSSKQEETGVAIIPALKLSKKENNTWNRRPLDGKRLQVLYHLSKLITYIALYSRKCFFYASTCK